MISLADHVQSVALDALGEGAEQRLEGLRPALRALRNAYRAGVAPDFGVSATRAAYVFGYHPHHCVLAAEALAAIGTSLLGIDGKQVVRVAVLGAGPAPELVALAWILQGRGMRIEAALVDREVGWEATRRTTLGATLHTWPIDVSVTHHTADLQDPKGLALVSSLVQDADIVIAQTVLTELDSPADEGQLVDHVTRRFGAKTRLVVIDFDRLAKTRQTTQRIDTATNVTMLTTAHFDIPAGRPVGALTSHFYDDADGLRPRKKLHCALRVMARPGAVAAESNPIEPTEDQAAALASFSEFLSGDGRVFVLRGGAGTGKTTLFPALVQTAATRGLPVVLLAPTGRAARRLREVVGRAGSTVHSHLYRYDATESRTDDDPPLAKFVLRDPPTEPAVYVIDEASLIGNRPDTSEDVATAEVVFGEGRLLSDLLATCLQVPDSRIVFVGDPNQLSPIGEELSPALDLSQLESLTGSRPECAELTEIVRQGEDSAIIDLARAWFAQGSTPQLCRHNPERGVHVLIDGEIEPWLIHEVREMRAAIVAGRNADVRAWNAKVRGAVGLGDRPPAEGERLLVVRTDIRTGLFNGDEVKVRSVDPDVEVVRVREDEVRLRKAQLAFATAAGPVSFETLLVDDVLAGATVVDQRKVSRVLHVDFIMRTGLRPGSRAFDDAYAHDERVHALRATYAYARTCHRAQGGEWDHVVVDFIGSRALGPGEGRWAYTALTRARRVVHLAYSGESAYDADRLLAEASERLSAVGIMITRHATIQHGLQLTVERSGASANVNIYLKAGLPSSCTRSGNDAGGLQVDALAGLHSWIAELRAATLTPLPQALERHAVRLAALLSPQGYDVQVFPRAQYEVTFSADAPTGAAAITYRHKSSGELSAELFQASTRDVTALATLRAAIEETRD